MNVGSNRANLVNFTEVINKFKNPPHNDIRTTLINTAQLFLYDGLPNVDMLLEVINDTNPLDSDINKRMETTNLAFDLYDTVHNVDTKDLPKGMESREQMVFHYNPLMDEQVDELLESVRLPIAIPSQEECVPTHFWTLSEQPILLCTEIQEPFQTDDQSSILIDKDSQLSTMVSESLNQQILQPNYYPLHEQSILPSRDKSAFQDKPSHTDEDPDFRLNVVLQIISITKYLPQQNQHTSTKNADTAVYMTYMRTWSYTLDSNDKMRPLATNNAHFTITRSYFMCQLIFLMFPKCYLNYPKLESNTRPTQKHRRKPTVHVITNIGGSNNIFPNSKYVDLDERIITPNDMCAATSDKVQSRRVGLTLRQGLCFVNAQRDMLFSYSKQMPNTNCHFKVVQSLSFGSPSTNLMKEFTVKKFILWIIRRLTDCLSILAVCGTLLKWNKSVCYYYIWLSCIINATGANTSWAMRDNQINLCQDMVINVTAQILLPGPFLEHVLGLENDINGEELLFNNAHTHIDGAEMEIESTDLHIDDADVHIDGADVHTDAADVQTYAAGGQTYTETFHTTNNYAHSGIHHESVQCPVLQSVINVQDVVGLGLEEEIPLCTSGFDSGDDTAQEDQCCFDLPGSEETQLKTTYVGFTLTVVNGIEGLCMSPNGNTLAILSGLQIHASEIPEEIDDPGHFERNLQCSEAPVEPLHQYIHCHGHEEGNTDTGDVHSDTEGINSEATDIQAETRIVRTVNNNKGMRTETAGVEEDINLITLECDETLVKQIIPGLQLGATEGIQPAHEHRNIEDLVLSLRSDPRYEDHGDPEEEFYDSQDSGRSVCDDTNDLGHVQIFPPEIPQLCFDLPEADEAETQVKTTSVGPTLTIVNGIEGGCLSDSPDNRAMSLLPELTFDVSQTAEPRADHVHWEAVQERPDEDVVPVSPSTDSQHPIGDDTEISDGCQNGAAGHSSELCELPRYDIFCCTLDIAQYEDLQDEGGAGQTEVKTAFTSSNLTSVNRTESGNLHITAALPDHQFSNIFEITGYEDLQNEDIDEDEGE